MKPRLKRCLCGDKPVSYACQMTFDPIYRYACSDPHCYAVPPGRSERTDEDARRSWNQRVDDARSGKVEVEDEGPMPFEL